MASPALGKCCAAMEEILTTLPYPLFRVEENGVMYLAVGYVKTPSGLGWFDQAPLFCPFCGKAIQDADLIRIAAGGSRGKPS